MTPAPLTSSLLARPHGFFTREGGASEGAYASLNCSLSGGDDRETVLENRRRVAAHFDRPPEALLGLKQVHSARCVTVTEPWAIGAGTDADAMATDRPGLLLGVITADCGPVLFADAEKPIIAAAHAGWTGAAAGVLEATVDSMIALGARAETICAVIGPCIQPPSYEVGDDMRAKVIADWPAAERFLAAGNRPDHYQFDLPGYCVARLERVGVRAASLGVDTLTDEARFYSHRRRTLAGGGVIGHQISVIGL